VAEPPYDLEMTEPSTEAYSRIVEAILKLSKEGGWVKIGDVAEYALLPRDRAADILSTLGLQGEEIRLTRGARIELILRALEWGMEGERVARYLDWQGFEELVGKIFERAGYGAEWDLRISLGGRRCQIDLLAYKVNLILLIDCKHWRRPPPPSSELKIVQAQERRLKMLKEALVKAAGEAEDARDFYLTPLVLSLYQPTRKIIQGHIFASIGNLRGLLDYLESAYFEVRHERLKLPYGAQLSGLISSIRRTRRDRDPDPCRISEGSSERLKSRGAPDHPSSHGLGGV